MKIILLIEDNDGGLNLEKSVDGISFYHINTQKCDDMRIEVELLLASIQFFMQSNYEVMLAFFSGNNNVVRAVGELRPEMIIPMSTNPKSVYYSMNIENEFKEIINLFREKETK